MIRKKALLLALLLFVAPFCASFFAQTGSASPAPQPPGQVVPAPGAPTGLPGGSAPAAASPNPGDGESGGSQLQPQHITIATPAPAPAPWTWQQRVSWGANLLLVVFAYIGIMMGISLLRKIERQAQASEDAAEAAARNASAVFDQVQSIVRAERPWILMSVRPAQDIENGFAVVATNRGRSPARILSLVEQVAVTVDEAHLPAAPSYKDAPVAPADPMILLPGETAEIASFSRMDVKRVCETAERMERIEKWEEKIFLYGNVVYCDLTTPDQAPAHESGWFCWYIHGRQKSGMVMTGPAPYNRHT
ncbi:MAG: hypothetical protein ACLGPM_07955 [Acidobacteriota bacterium]